MLIQVVIPRTLHLKDKITSFYTELYLKYRKENPQSKDYTYKMLRKNIASVAAFGKTSIDELKLRPTQYNEWSKNDWKEYHFSHWYFAIELMKNSNNQPVAYVRDAHYEGYHHNDNMQTRPYNESIQKVLSLIKRIETL